MSYRADILDKINQAAVADAKELNLANYGMTSLPPEIGNLSNLTKLVLQNNDLTHLPVEIGKLQNLQILDISDNNLLNIPEEVGNLSKLTKLDLSNNQLSFVASCVGTLLDLIDLNLKNNKITSIASEIGNLRNLAILDLSTNSLKELPIEIGLLSSLSVLYIHVNNISEIPHSIGHLTNLVALYMFRNKITRLPNEIGELSSLRRLDISENLLSELPTNIANLKQLCELEVAHNQLTDIPPEVAFLSGLTTFNVFDNPLSNIPPEVINQGTTALFAYLAAQLKATTRQWVSKMLVVGQGGVGKTSLLRTLRGELFNEKEDTTHGIEIHSLNMAHPQFNDIMMRLNTWDFGGQEIYHATHQFFLTNRSLFLLAWNARHGFEQGRLYYWLDTIQALAPNSPILLVATHIDQREPDLPYADLKRSYPQIVGQCAISNSTAEGIPNLRTAIANAASGLPLMGEKWPTAWLNAANNVRSLNHRYAKISEMWKRFERHDVRGKDAEVLVRWLHELGDILYFENNEELIDTVILKPQWVTAHISKVLESRGVIENNGLLMREEMEHLWADLDTTMQERFLPMMEQFDLSYRTLQNREISLIVERLPLDEADYHIVWNSIASTGSCHQISLKYELNTLPAGIPTWFIARQHRFTTHTHWRYGVLLKDTIGEHLALITASPHDRTLHLSVRGPYPNNFFALLKDGLELTFRRFPGLAITRRVPCACSHNCQHMFDYDHLVKRVNIKHLIECPLSLKEVSVIDMLFGVAPDVRNVVMSKLDSIEKSNQFRHEELIRHNQGTVALLQREFLKIYNTEQALIESHCPNVFLLRPHSSDDWRSVLTRISGAKIELNLCCQAPGCWHQTTSGGQYIISQPHEWLVRMAPYVKGLVNVLKYVTPFVAPGLGITLPKIDDEFKEQFKITEELVKHLPDVQQDEPFNSSSLDGNVEHGNGLISPNRVEGAALRFLRAFLDEQDPKQQWGGLRKVLTPEGHYLWLCEEHANEYRK